MFYFYIIFNAHQSFKLQETVEHKTNIKTKSTKLKS